MHTLRKYARDVFDDSNIDLYNMDIHRGELALRQQIAHYLFNSRGVTCHPNQIIIGSSTEQLLDMITDVLSDSSFIIEQPKLSTN